jgi:quercetin dioxygenase-like cupin family protein
MKRENPTIEICPGITRRTVAHGETMYQMLATLAAGSRMPAHTHPQEQIVHILEGKMRLIVEGLPHELSTGDSFYLASNVFAWCGDALGDARARYVQSAAD